MATRSVALFWAAVVSAVGSLGTGWAAWHQADGIVRIAVLTVAGAGLMGAGLVAARIIVVVAGAQRRARLDGLPASPQQGGQPAAQRNGAAPR